jgi:hypothetical protein
MKRMLATVHSVVVRGESGQSMTETAVIAAALLGGGSLLLMQFAPDALQAFTIYLHGFYVVLGYPIG